jgi:hypothetical protein
VEPLLWTSLEERRSSERSPLWKTLPFRLRKQGLTHFSAYWIRCKGRPAYITVNEPLTLSTQSSKCSYISCAFANTMSQVGHTPKRSWNLLLEVCLSSAGLFLCNIESFGLTECTEVRCLLKTSTRLKRFSAELPESGQNPHTMVPL